MDFQNILKLIELYWEENLSSDEFSEAFFNSTKEEVNEDLVIEGLSKAIIEKDSIKVDAYIQIGFIIGFTKKSINVLNDLLIQTYHHKHEDIAMLFSDFKDPVTIPSLYKAALMRLDYLDYDDTYQLARKCIKALGKIANEEAEEKIILLSHNEIPIISNYAQKELNKFAQ